VLVISNASSVARKGKNNEEDYGAGAGAAHDDPVGVSSAHSPTSSLTSLAAAISLSPPSPPPPPVPPAASPPPQESDPLDVLAHSLNSFQYASRSRVGSFNKEPIPSPLRGASFSSSIADTLPHATMSENNSSDSLYTGPGQDQMTGVTPSLPRSHSGGGLFSLSVPLNELVRSRSGSFEYDRMSYSSQLSDLTLTPGFSARRAVFTLQDNWEIVLVNRFAGDLFGCEGVDLIGKNFQTLFGEVVSLHHQSFRTHHGETANVVLFDGAIVDALHRSGQWIPVSLWVKLIRAGKDSPERKWIAVVEEAKQQAAIVRVSPLGEILGADNEFWGTFCPEAVPSRFRVSLSEFLPKLEPLGELVRRRERSADYYTGVTSQGYTIPLILSVQEDRTDNNQPVYQVTLKWLKTVRQCPFN